MNKLYLILATSFLFSCVSEFDNEIVISDLRTGYPELEIIEISSYPCDGTFGDCYYVKVTFKPTKFTAQIDTSFQYSRLGNPENPLVINDIFANSVTGNIEERESQPIEFLDSLLQMNVWGLHNLTKITSIESNSPLGETDARITFESDSTLLEYDSGIERIYRWKITEDSQLKIKKINGKESERYKSLLRLEQIIKINQLDSLNLVLTTSGEAGSQYRYHYHKFN